MNETAQKILGFIKRLPETWDGQPLRQQALDNFDEKFSSLPDINEIDERIFIECAFPWGEGSKKYYWSNINKLLLNGTIQLLPEVEEKKDEFVFDEKTKIEFSDFILNNAVGDYTFNSLLQQFKASKQRKPLFVTEDGKQIFEGDDFWTVNPYESNFYVQKWNCDTTEDGKATWLKYFSTEAAANEYVRLNKPMYSLNDIGDAWGKLCHEAFTYDQLITELEKLKQ